MTDLHCLEEVKEFLALRMPNVLLIIRLFLDPSITWGCPNMCSTGTTDLVARRREVPSTPSRSPHSLSCTPKCRGHRRRILRHLGAVLLVLAYKPLGAAVLDVGLNSFISGAVLGDDLN